jgi:hypothetical protein
VCDSELTLSDSITKPMKPHVDALGFFLFHCVGGQPNGKIVVAQDGPGRLGVAESGGNVAKPNALLREDECCAVFRLSSRGYNHGDDGADSVDHAVLRGGVIDISEITDSTSY